MAYQSFERLLRPATIHYDQAIAIAVVGLLVNLACARLLHVGDHHGHGHGDVHDAHHDHGHHHHADLNLRSAYLHVLADAATRSEEHTSELQSLMRISYAVFCFKKRTYTKT